MKLLTPLGLLGLLGIVVLIIIYIIKPNYQQKFLSSTFIWQLSLKRKRKKLPISRLRNFLIILCQILILTACTAVLTSPMKVLKVDAEHDEVVLIIDSSASMMAQTDGVTRFERAVNNAKEMATQVAERGGVVSVVIADTDPHFLAERAPAANKDIFLNDLTLLGLDMYACSYGSSDIDGAVTMCADILDDNPHTKFFVYTDNEYYYYDTELVTVVPVSDQSEWNAAILNAYSEFNDGCYSIIVDVATYGIDLSFDVKVTALGVNPTLENPDGETLSLSANVVCTSDNTQRIVFTSDESMANAETFLYVPLEDNERIYSYDNIEVSIGEPDSFMDDNRVYIYGGQKPQIKIQYASTLSNNFFNGILMVFQNIYGNTWDIQITESNKGEPALEGYDFYIFEHTMPERMPVDGVVMLVNPDEAPRGADFRVSRDVLLQRDVMFTAEAESPILRNIIPENISVQAYKRLSAVSSDYETLMSCDGDPMLLVRNSGDVKTVIMPFSVHYSNLSILADFPLMMINIFNYFFPATVTGNAFEVGEVLDLNARGELLTVTDPVKNAVEYKTFPATMVATLPGAYSLNQTTYFGVEVNENIYVKVPAKESNIWNMEDRIVSIYSATDASQYFQDLLFYLAIALVTLLFAEWLLHLKEM